VLGGTRFVGRAVVADALARGWDVTAVHRGVTGALPSEVATLGVDRSDPAALEAALGDGRWDGVVDTWSGAPAVATAGAALLAGRAERYAFASSISLYRWGSTGTSARRSWTATPRRGTTSTTRRSSAAPRTASRRPSPMPCSRARPRPGAARGHRPAALVAPVHGLPEEVERRLLDG